MTIALRIDIVLVSLDVETAKYSFELTEEKKNLLWKWEKNARKRSEQ